MRRRRSDLGDWRGSQSSLRSGEVDHAYLNRRTTVHNMNQTMNSEYYPRDAEYANMDYHQPRSRDPSGYNSRDSLPPSGYNSRDSLPSGYRLVLVKDQDLATTPHKEVVGNPWYQDYSAENSQTED